MPLAENEADLLDEALRSAQTEAEAAFGMRGL